MSNVAVLGGLLLAAVVFDLLSRRIPNWLTLSGAVAGVALGVSPGGIGIVQSAGGLALGLALFLPLYALRAMGAADVKLMAAVGSLLGLSGTFAAAVYALAIGGLIAFLYALKAGVVRQLFANLRSFAYASATRMASGAVPSPSDMPLTALRAPFVLAIAGGASLQLLVRYLGVAGA